MPRKVRDSTVNRYIGAARVLMAQLQKPTQMDTSVFAHEQRVTANFVSVLTDAGIVRRLENSTYVWAGPLPTFKTMKRLVAESPRLARRPKKDTAVSEPEAKEAPRQQNVLDLHPPAAQKPDRITELENQVQELTDRVAAMERLMIRRAIA